MHIRILLGCALLACAAAHARPLVVQRTQALGIQVDHFAVTGDRLIATRLRPDPNSQFGGIVDASHYRRSASGVWQLQGLLLSETTPTRSGEFPVAVSGSHAAVNMPSGLHVFELTSAGWTERPVNSPTRPRAVALDLQGTTLLASDQECDFNGAPDIVVLDRQASGSWAESARIPGFTNFCPDALDFDGSSVIAHYIGWGDPTIAPARVTIHERSGGGWVSAATFNSAQALFDRYGSAVAIEGALAAVSGSGAGAHLYRRSSAGWVASGRLPNPDVGDELQNDRVIRIVGGRIFKSGYGYHNADVVRLFAPASSGGFTHVASFAPTDFEGVSDVEIVGSRVYTAEYDMLVEFDIPTSFAVPALAQDDFEQGTTSLTPLPGSQFSIVASGGSQVYRQSSLVGDAGAIHPMTHTTQSISADIQINAFNGADRWVGLMTRYQDDGNYYYVTLRGTDELVIKRMRNGTFTALAFRGMTIDPGQRLHLTFESSGSRHNVYVNGRIFAWAFDDELRHGRAGLRMYRASADFDNVVVTPGPVEHLAYQQPTMLGGSWSSGIDTFTQNNISATARRLTGLPREDNYVQADFQVRAFNSNGTPWAGLIARYEDVDNYYYVSVRRGSPATVSLRRLVNGQIQVLDTAPLGFNPLQPMLLRLEAIGDRVRVFVNSELRCETTGAEIVAGRVGTMTYLSTAQFSNYTAVQP